MVYPALQSSSDRQTCLGIGKCVSGWSDKGPTKAPKRFEGALSDSFISASNNCWIRIGPKKNVVLAAVHVI